jgi:hypothetical protein
MDTNHVVDNEGTVCESPSHSGPDSSCAHAHNDATAALYFTVLLHHVTAGVMAPQLRGFVRALDERLINAVQETAVNVTRFFLPQVSDTGYTCTDLGCPCVLLTSPYGLASSSPHCRGPPAPCQPSGIRCHPCPMILKDLDQP